MAFNSVIAKVSPQVRCFQIMGDILYLIYNQLKKVRCETLIVKRYMGILGEIDKNGQRLRWNSPQQNNLSIF